MSQLDSIYIFIPYFLLYFCHLMFESCEMFVGFINSSYSGKISSFECLCDEIVLFKFYSLAVLNRLFDPFIYITLDDQCGFLLFHIRY